jgi:hypothetical protein
MKTYLDETQYNEIVKNFITDLSFDFSEGYRLGVENLPCRRADGFIPHSNNHGGFDVVFMTGWSSIWGSGTSLCDGFDTDQAEKERKDANKSFWRDNPELAKDIPESKRNYHDLYEMERGELAEKLDEYEMEYVDTDPILYGLRAMYEGVNEEGTHTLVLYAIATDDRYHGFNYGKTIESWDLEFKNKEDLVRILEILKPEIESTF